MLDILAKETALDLIEIKRANLRDNATGGPACELPTTGGVRPDHSGPLQRPHHHPTRPAGPGAPANAYIELLEL